MNEQSTLFPDGFPAPWANEWGEDDQGLWMALVYRGVRYGFRWLPPGRFLMGSPEDEDERESFGADETLHEVVLSRGLWLGETTVTQALWEAAMGGNPSLFKGAERPVERVSWEDAQGFMEKLNKECPDLGLRLPTEAEWEYGCRAGDEDYPPFSFGETITTDQANYDGNYPYAGGKKGIYRQETVEVEALPANDWGLVQMHGNVWEWCRDWYGAYPPGPVTDPPGPETGADRVLRGGGWISNAGNLRSAYRSHMRPGDRDDVTGFRLARG